MTHTKPTVLHPKRKWEIIESTEGTRSIDSAELAKLRSDKEVLLKALEDLLADVLNLGSFSITSRKSVYDAREAIKEVT